MNNGFSDALVRRIDGQQHAFHTSTGTLYLPYEVVHCKLTDDGWIQDPDRPAEPSPFAGEGTPFAGVPLVPLAATAQPKPRLRIVPLPGDRADFLIVLDRADEALAVDARRAVDPTPDDEHPKLLRDRIFGCAGVVTFAAEVEVE